MLNIKDITATYQSPYPTSLLGFMLYLNQRFSGTFVTDRTYPMIESAVHEYVSNLFHQGFICEVSKRDITALLLSSLLPDKKDSQRVR